MDGHDGCSKQTKRLRRKFRYLPLRLHPAEIFHHPSNPRFQGFRDSKSEIYSRRPGRNRQEAVNHRRCRDQRLARRIPDWTRPRHCRKLTENRTIRPSRDLLDPERGLCSEFRAERSGHLCTAVASMCNAALEDPPSRPDNKDVNDEISAASAAASAAAAAAEQGSMGIASATPRHRRPSTQHPHHCARRHATTAAPPSTAAGRGPLRTPSERIAPPPSPAKTIGSSSVGHSPARGALAEQCSQCDGGRGSNQRNAAGWRRDNWSLEKAVAATWGAGEWLGLGLLRKRRRSGSSSLSR